MPGIVTKAVKKGCGQWLQWLISATAEGKQWLNLIRNFVKVIYKSFVNNPYVLISLRYLVMPYVFTFYGCRWGLCKSAWRLTRPNRSNTLVTGNKPAYSPQLLRCSSVRDLTNSYNNVARDGFERIMARVSFVDDLFCLFSVCLWGPISFRRLYYYRELHLFICGWVYNSS